MNDDAGTNMDLVAAIAAWGILACAVLAFTIARIAWGARGHERLAREKGLPLLGKVPMEAVYAAMLPIGRGLARFGVTANTVTLASLVVASGAGVLFANGHFGVGAAVAIVATLADALDGIVARETKSAGRFGQVLDTTIDRYVDAILLGSIAVFVRTEIWLLVLTIGAIVGGFMVSYASSVLRELKADDSDAPMRRAHRVAYLLGAAMLVPFAELALPRAALGLRIAPLVVALGAIAVIGNVSAIARLLRAARIPEPQQVTGQAPLVSLTKSSSSEHPNGRINSVITRERFP